MRPPRPAKLKVIKQLPDLVRLLIEGRPDSLSDAVPAAVPGLCAVGLLNQMLNEVGAVIIEDDANRP